MSGKRPTTVSEYISAAPKEARPKLRELRALIAAAAPGATQSLKWSMPAFSHARILVTFAAFKKHIGFFPTPSAIREFKKDLAGFQTSAGTVRLPLDRPLPRALITRITKFRVQELEARDAKWMARRVVASRGADAGRSGIKRGR